MPETRIISINQMRNLTKNLCSKIIFVRRVAQRQFEGSSYTLLKRIHQTENNETTEGRKEKWKKKLFSQVVSVFVLKMQCTQWVTAEHGTSSVRRKGKRTEKKIWNTKWDWNKVSPANKYRIMGFFFTSLFAYLMCIDFALATRSCCAAFNTQTNAMTLSSSFYYFTIKIDDITNEAMGIFLSASRSTSSNGERQQNRISSKSKCNDGNRHEKCTKTHPITLSSTESILRCINSQCVVVYSFLLLASLRLGIINKNRCYQSRRNARKKTKMQ